MNMKPNRYFTNSKGERFNLEGHFVDYEGNFINYDGEFLEGFFHGKVLSDNPDYKVPECIFSVPGPESACRHSCGHRTSGSPMSG